MNMQVSSSPEDHFRNCLNIYDWIFSIFLEASGSYDQVSLHFDYDFPQRFIAEPPFPLLDPTNGRRRVMLYGSSRTLTSVCYQMVQVLLQRKQQTWQDVELEFLLWCAVSSSDSDTLRLCLKVTREKERCLPSSLLSSLLGRALELFFLDGVKLILSYGADPNKGTDPYSNKAPLLKISEVHNSLLINPSFVDRALTEITKNLLKFGADPLIRGESGQIALHDLSRLVLHAADCAALLIKATPPIGYQFLQSGTNQVPAMSPLTAAFYSASWAPQNQRTARLARIFSFAIIPLLRCGATLLPDPLEEPSLEMPSAFLFLPELYSAVPESYAIWGLARGPIVFAQIALEARQKGSLDVGGLAKLEASLTATVEGNHRQQEGMSFSARVQNLCAFFRAQFPRSLQALCRLQIHRNLPPGHDRPRAIKSLGLPLCLEDFLTFREFDILPEALVFETATDQS